MAERREHGLWAGALAMALLAPSAPLAAQTVPATTNSTAPAPSPAPADPGQIGPPQLRDFTLNGTVTRPAEPVVTAPAPTTTAPRPVPDPSAPVVTAPARTTPAVAGPDRDSSPESVAIDLPTPAPADEAAISPGLADAAPDPAPNAALPAEGEFPWPWLLAALAVLGGGIMLWRKRQQTSGNNPSYAGVSELAGASALPPPPMPRAAPAEPPPAAPRPAAPAAALSDGRIVSSGLRPKLGFELHPIRAETDDRQNAALLFDVVVANHGHAPARNVLVEAKMLNAGPLQDEHIGRFFREPVGEGERLPVIPPMGRISIKTRLAITKDEMRPIEVEGRLLFVPLVAFNALYRWSGGEEQDSASFLVGRDQEENGKMAPFRLDQGAKSWTGLGARPHSLGLQR